MFTRVLTDVERRRIKSYLKADGEKETPVRMIAYRAKRYMPIIRSDLDLLEKLLRTYTTETKGSAT